MATQLKPAKAIRRFDVFAEYRKLDAEADGMPEDEAKGYGLWVAKVVAARKFGRKSNEPAGESPPSTRGKWHVLSGEPQTDKRFDHEIVERMGRDFYTRVFAPRSAKHVQTVRRTSRCAIDFVVAGSQPDRLLAAPHPSALGATLPVEYPPATCLLACQRRCWRGWRRRCRADPSGGTNRSSTASVACSGDRALVRSTC